MRTPSITRGLGAMPVVCLTAALLSTAPLAPATAEPAPAISGPAISDPAISDLVTPTAVMPGPDTDACPHRLHPPPAVDESEAVPPGAPAPAPLPVPDVPVGGERLGGCGVVADPAAGPLPDRLTSAGWLIADLDSGRVIAAEDPHGRYRPASTIKTLLAVVALDELDLDQRVEATADDWAIEGDSCGMGPGGTYTVRDLLSGLLVVSGNDCANALARRLGGSDTALAKMNAKAAALGAHDTRAASPSGLDAAGMSTSPYDLAVIFREAMRNDTFRRLIAMKTYLFPGYPKRPDVPDDVDHPAWTMGTSNVLLREDWPGMLGGKTGFTDDARKTFVGAAERDGRRVVIVQMYGLNEADNSYAQQAERMFDYGFAAPGSTSVGSLESSAPTASADTAPAEHRSAVHHDDPSARNVWSIGLFAVAGLCLAAAVGLRVRRRNRR